MAAVSICPCMSLDVALTSSSYISPFVFIRTSKRRPRKQILMFVP